MRSKCALTSSLWCTVLTLAMCAAVARAQDPPADAPAAEAATETVVAEVAVVEAPAVPAANLPPYFTATTPQPGPDGKEQAPFWPDATGAKSGAWAAPSGDTAGGGDVPESLQIPDLYDRIAHNLFSINMVWTLIAGFLVMFMQAGFAMVEAGLCRAKNARPHVGDELDDLSARLHRVLGLWFRDRLGQLVQRPGRRRAGTASLGPGTDRCSTAASASSRRFRRRHGIFKYGLLGTKGFFLQRRRRRQRDGAVLLHDGVHGHHGHDSHRRHGRTLGLEEFLSLRAMGGAALLHLCQLGMGRRLAGASRARTGAWATGRSTLPARAWCTPWAASSPWPGPSCWARASANTSTASRRPLPGHNIPMVVVGTFILAFGWFGFNPGSTLAGTDLRI